MKLGLAHEGDCLTGSSHYERYHEMVAEAVRAEHVGFDFYGCSEQHFLPVIATTSAPEGLMNVVAAKTERIKLRFMSAVLSVNHPVRIVERLNTLDIMSHGRAQLGTARSNNLNTLQAFGVSPRDTRAMQTDGLQVIGRALGTGNFGFQGDLYDIPERPVVPQPVQDPHPPIFLSATSDTSHELAGKWGLGVMSGNTILGWDYLENNIKTYWDATADPDPISKVTQRSAGTWISTAHCAPTMEQALREAEPVARQFLNVVLDMYTKLSPESPDYAYLGQIEKIRDHADDIATVQELSPYFHIGTPEYLAERFQRLADMGLTELILRIDGMGHETNLTAIERIAQDVLPKVQTTAAPAADG